MGVPCCHAIACNYFLNREAEEYVNECYKREVYLRCYANPVPVCEGERQWPRVEKNLDPPPIKIGPGRPRRNRIKDPFENPKKPGTIIRHGMEMTCKLCNEKGHNKRGCPNKGTAVPQEPPPKKDRGRPRKYPAPQPEVGASNEPLQPSHHSVSAQPSQLGRGGRMILGGVGARGRGTGRGAVGSGRGSSAGRGSTIRGRGNGRGRGRGRNQVPIGVGVYFTPDGTPMSSVVDGRGRQTEINLCTQSS
ncbi:Gag-Pol polyprotein [Bienertia sinuspersici]